MDSKGYNTKQRSSLLKFFEENKERCFSAKELVKNENINLGEATIYRSLSKFVNEGKIKKFISSGSEGALYQYSQHSPECSNHFHLKCTQCGVLFHMDCSLMSNMKLHIESEHNFIIDNSKTTFYGLCSRCNC